MYQEIQQHRHETESRQKCQYTWLTKIQYMLIHYNETVVVYTHIYEKVHNV